MNLIDLLFLAVALGIDCLVVSFSLGLIVNEKRLKNSFALASTMGLFQGLMPIISYIGTSFVSEYLKDYSSWIVFFIFMILGIKFIYEAFQEKEANICCIGFKCLLGLGLATSIDALAAGVTLKLSNTPLILSVLVIGITSFIMSIKGFWFASMFKKFPSKYLEVTGGIILIFLAIKACL